MRIKFFMLKQIIITVVFDISSLSFLFDVEGKRKMLSNNFEMLCYFYHMK